MLVAGFVRHADIGHQRWMNPCAISHSRSVSKPNRRSGRGRTGDDGANETRRDNPETYPPWALQRDAAPGYDLHDQHDTERAEKLRLHPMPRRRSKSVPATSRNGHPGDHLGRCHARPLAGRHVMPGINGVLNCLLVLSVRPTGTAARQIHAASALSCYDPFRRQDHYLGSPSDCFYRMGLWPSASGGVTSAFSDPADP